MDAGKYRHRVTLQSPTGSQSAATGERTTTWSAEASDIPAMIQPFKAREHFAAQQAQSSTTHRILIRYGSEISDIDASWRVVYGSRVFVIDGIRNIDEMNRTYELLCTEGLKTE